MSRTKLEAIAIKIYVERNTGNGITAAEATRRAKALMPGNTTPQLRKFVKKYGIK